MNPIDEFWKISSDATKHVGNSFNAPDVIEYGKQIVELVERHQDSHKEFVNAFIEGAVSPDKCDRWLVEFCMHALRLPDAKQEFERMSKEAITKNDWNKIQALQHILDAFEDNWSDASDIYAEYFQKP
jgi:hypothetical protein